MQLYVNVLTQGFWPTYPPVEITLPPEVILQQKMLFGEGAKDGMSLQLK
jgi:hypothetical protein